MHQIADWLEKLGLSEDTARLARNGIDISGLRYLTDQKLKDIRGLLGHRRKMLAAISELTGATPVTSEAAAVEAQPKAQDSAERRQVTVMFWTSLVRQHSPLGWIRKTCESSSRPIGNAPLKLCAAS